jgi:RNA chaperone Hfq
VTASNQPPPAPSVAPAETGIAESNYVGRLRRDAIPVAVTLVGGVKVTGTITATDRFTITLRRRRGVLTLLFKHAIMMIDPLTIAPTANGASSDDESPVT